LQSQYPQGFAILLPSFLCNLGVYSTARDPETGKQLLTMKDFALHGLAAFAISLAVLWGWAFLGYWRWVGA